MFVIVLNRCMIWKIVLIATPITHAWNDSTYKFGHAIYDIRLNIAFHTQICVVKSQVGTWKYVNVCLISLNIIEHIMHVPLKGEYSSVYILLILQNTILFYNTTWIHRQNRYNAILGFWSHGDGFKPGLANIHYDSRLL